MEKIKLRIKDQASIGVKRVVILQYIQFDLESKVGFFTVKEKYINTTETEIEDQNIITRIITVDISNDTKVTITGIPITLDFIKSTRPIKVDETPEAYEIRMQKRLDAELLLGIKEFEYWADLILNPAPLLEAIKVFNNLGKFD